MDNARSTFAINGHPLHPMVVPFPIALFVSALITDTIYAHTMDGGWANGSYWLIVGGLVMAAIAAIGGIVEFVGDTRIQRLNDAWWHAAANVVVVLIELFSLYSRHKYGTEAVVPLGISLSVVSAILLLFSGWKGGELVFKHRVAVRD
jgi:uncharacterized membrane protein